MIWEVELEALLHAQMWGVKENEESDDSKVWGLSN